MYRKFESEFLVSLTEDPCANGNCKRLFTLMRYKHGYELQSETNHMKVVAAYFKVLSSMAHLRKITKSIMVEVSSGNKLTSEVDILLLITPKLKYLNI
jgi:hypothetical protein